MEFHAIRGIQGKIEVYTINIPFRIIPRIFGPSFTYKVNSPFEKFQREISYSRVHKIEKYLLENKDYVLPAITVSIEGDIEFKPLNEEEYYIGKLVVPDDSLWIINDGQHRVKAIETLMRLYNEYVMNPKSLPSGIRKHIRNNENRISELQYHTIPAVCFVNLGTERNQQIFSDINRNMKRTSGSLNVLFDNRDEDARYVKEFLQSNPELLRIVEVEKTSTREKAYTIVDIYNVRKQLKGEFDTFVEKLISTFSFDLPADKEKYIYPFSVFLSALVEAFKEDKTVFEKLDIENLKKENLEGIVIFDGKIKKDRKTIDRLKKHILAPQKVLIK